MILSEEKKIKFTPNSQKNKMETLCVPLLLMIAILLQICQSSTDDVHMVKKRIFKEVKGLEKIFKFFGDEMDAKAKMVITPGETVLRYDETRATFFQNLLHEIKRQHVNHKTLQNNIICRVGKDPMLVGLKNLLINHCE